MNETHVQKCQRCGNALPSDAPQGLCPRCLGRLNFATDTALPGTEVVAAQPPLSPQEIAPHFPQLEILECLGRGGMGVVYKARQKSLNRVVALKLLAPERVQDETFAERFAREAQALARLSHPHIVTVHDFGQAGGFFYLIMEFVDGVNLGQLLAASRLSPHEALTIVPQICDALQYAHDQGIVHRDIKPENILMDRQGRVKVADFGLAKLVGAEVNGVALSPGGRESGQRPGAVETPALTEAGKVMGTPSYMAPEQQERPAAVDHRADIYALGVVFYQMLTGELPGKRLEPPSKKVLIDVRLDEVVLRALEKEPERRYQQVSQVKTAVEMIVSSRAQEPTELVPKLRWRDRWLWDTHNGFAWVLKAVLAVFALLLVPLLLPFLLWPPVIGGVMGFIAIYGWVGHRIRMLKAALPPGEAEVAEGWLAWPQGMWPFNRSQGLAILHDDRLELVPVWYGGTHTIPLADITSVRQAHWVYVPLVWKHGLELELANGQRVSLAVPEPIGRRWQALLSREKPSAVPALSEADLSAVRQQLQTPATGLMVAGALTFVPAVILAAAMMVGFVLFPLLALAEGLPDTIGWRKILFMLLASAWALPGFLVWLGARRMTRLQDRGWALAASLVAMITPPGCLVGLPFGIWALVVLNRPAVCAAFRQKAPQPASQASPPRNAKVTWTYVVFSAIPLLCLVISTLVLSQRYEQVGFAKQEVSWDGRYFAMASARNASGPFTGDRNYYQFRVGKKAGGLLHEWKVMFPANGGPITNAQGQVVGLCDFSKDGHIEWAEDSSAVRFFVHNVEVAGYNFILGTPTKAAHLTAARSAGLAIRRVVVTGDKAVVEGYSGAGAVIECGLRGVSLNLVNILDAGRDFTAEAGYTVESGLSLGARRTGTRDTLSGTVQSRQLDANFRLAEGRMVFRQGPRLPEPDGSYFIADYHPKEGPPLPVFVRLAAKLRWLETNDKLGAYRWRVERPVPLRLVCGVLDVTDEGQPRALLSTIESQVAGGTNDLQFRLELQTNTLALLTTGHPQEDLRVRMEGLAVPKTGGDGHGASVAVPVESGSGATLDGLPRTELRVAVLSEPVSLSVEHYRVLLEVDVVTRAAGGVPVFTKRLQVVMRLAAADDSVEQVLGKGDTIKRVVVGRLLPESIALTLSERAFAMWLRAVKPWEFMTTGGHTNTQAVVELLTRNLRVTTNFNFALPALMPLSKVIERTINDLDERQGNEALHFRSGRLSAIPADAQTNRNAFDAWFKTNQMDMLADFARNRWALLSVGIELFPMNQAVWDNITSEQVQRALTGSWEGIEVLERNGRRFFLLHEKSQPPLTFAFRTRDGDQGVMQITEFTNGSRSVSLRYKLVQAGQTNSAFHTVNQ